MIFDRTYITDENYNLSNIQPATVKIFWHVEEKKISSLVLLELNTF